MHDTAAGDCDGACDDSGVDAGERVGVVLAHAGHVGQPVFVAVGVCDGVVDAVGDLDGVRDLLAVLDELCVCDDDFVLFRDGEEDFVLPVPCSSRRAPAPLSHVAVPRKSRLPVAPRVKSANVPREGAGVTSWVWAVARSKVSSAAHAPSTCTR